MVEFREIHGFANQAANHIDIHAFRRRRRTGRREDSDRCSCAAPRDGVEGGGTEAAGQTWNSRLYSVSPGVSGTRVTENDAGRRRIPAGCESSNAAIRQVHHERPITTAGSAHRCIGSFRASIQLHSTLLPAGGSGIPADGIHNGARSVRTTPAAPRPCPGRRLRLGHRPSG